MSRFLNHLADLVHALELVVKPDHFANQAAVRGGHRYCCRGWLGDRLAGARTRQLRNRTPQLINAALQAALAGLAIGADELGHLFEGLVHGVTQIQLSLRALFLRHELFPLCFRSARYLLVQIADLRLQCADAGIHVVLHLHQVLLRGGFPGHWQDWPQE